MVEPVQFTHNPKIKQLNYIRPRYFLGHKIGKKNTLIVAVTPGEDYVHHYAGMLRYYLSSLTFKESKLLKIIRYPDLEDAIATWTYLNNFICKGDFLILGFVHEIISKLKDNLSMELISKKENEYYLSYRYLLETGQILNFLGVKYSFWGNISAKLVQQSCALGIEMIAYIGKLGCMTHAGDLYDRIFSPSKYLYLRGKQVLGFTTKVENPFVKVFPELDSGWHVSVPTVIEEDYAQKSVAASFNCTSIDNEISQMALAINSYNCKTKSQKIPFLPIHFATDYLRNEHEKEIYVPHDLSTNRTVSSEGKKNDILNKITDYLRVFLEKKGMKNVI